MMAELEAVRWRDDPRAWRRLYARDYRRGIRRPRTKRSVLVRVLDRLDRTAGPIVDPKLGPCWPWTGAVNSDGYGVIRGDNGTLVLVHRVTLAAALGRPIAEGMFSCHKCQGVRHCARPRHLYEGTKVENEADKRGREWGLIKPPTYGAEVAR